MKEKMTESRLIEKCLQIMPDYFLLVVLASYRAHELSSGAVQPSVAKGSKYWITALEDIAEGRVSLSKLKEDKIKSYEHYRFLSQLNAQDS